MSCFYSQWLLPSHDSYHWVVRQIDQFCFIEVNVGIRCFGFHFVSKVSGFFVVCAFFVVVSFVRMRVLGQSSWFLKFFTKDLGVLLSLKFFIN